MHLLSTYNQYGHSPHTWAPHGAYIPDFPGLSPREVVPFAQTSQTALALSLPIVDLGETFRWACEDNNEQAMQFVLPSILYAMEKDPGMVFDALANACRSRRVKAVRLLINAGVPVELPRGLSRYSLGPRFYNTPLGCAMRDSQPELHIYQAQPHFTMQ